jgi:nucleoside 2-deoxyribosyltransferase
MKPKVYIAGKITGVAHYREQFARAERLLAAEGFAVLNPAVLPEGMSQADYMRICFAMIDTADTVAFLDNFSDSPGAMLELEYCKYIQKHAFLFRATGDEDEPIQYL